MIIRLTENRLRRLVEEALNEALGGPDVFGGNFNNSTYYGKVNRNEPDARDLDREYRERIIKEFPQWKGEIYRHPSMRMYDLYMDLKYRKEKEDKLQRKKENAAKRAERKEKARMKEVMKVRERSLFLNTVMYLVNGEEHLMGKNVYNDKDTEIPEGWYDGVEKIPVVLRDGNKTWATINSMGGSSQKSINGEGYLTKGTWGVTLKGVKGKDAEANIMYSVYAQQGKKGVYFIVDATDNPLVYRPYTSAAVSKYLTSQARKKMAEVAEKIEKYNTPLMRE